MTSDRPEHQLESIRLFGVALGQAGNPDEVYSAALAALIGSLPAASAALLLATPTGPPRLVAWRGPAIIPPALPWSEQDSAAQPVVVATTAAATLGPEVLALSYVPLIYRDRVLGAFAIHYATPHHFSADELEFAGLVAGHTAAALDRRQVEEVLRSSRDQLQVILQSIADGVMVQDQQGKIVFVNAAGARAMGAASAEELLNTPTAAILDRFEILDEERRPLDLNRLPARLALRGDPSPEQIICFRHRNGGDEHWSIVRATPIFDGGLRQLAVSIFTDITALKQAEGALQRSEQSYRFLTETVPQIIWTTRPDGWVEYFNACWFQYTGLTMEQSAGNGWEQVIHPDDLPQCREVWQQALQSGTSYEIEHRFRRADGVYSWYLSRALPMRDAAGAIVAWFGSSTDIDAQKQAEAHQQVLAAAAASSANTVAQLQELTAALSGALTPAQVAEVVLKQGLPALNATAGSIALLAADGQTVQIVGAAGYPASVIAPWLTFKLDDAVPLADAIRSGAPVWLSGGDADYERYNYLESFRSVPISTARAAVPLIFEQRAIGALGLSFDTMRTFDASEQAFMLALARQCAQAMERARLFEAELRARAEAEQAQRRLQFLAEAGATLGASLDYATTLASVARLVVPDLADWCLIDVIESEQTVQRVAVVNANSAHDAAAAALKELYVPSFSFVSATTRVLTGGQAELYTAVDEPVLRAIARNEQHFALLSSLNIDSAMFVPLLVGGRAVGAMTLFAAESGRHYGSADLALMGDLARRAALAVENARLYRDAREAVRVREDFVSIASHELRTPVTVVQGYTQALLRFVRKTAEAQGSATPDDTVTVERKRLIGGLEKIESAVARLSALAVELLDVGRMQNRSLDIVAQRMDLNALLATVVDSARVRSSSPERPGVDLRLLLPPGVVWGEWDRDRLEQVFLNLLDNAVKYSINRGAVSVSLQLEAAPGGGAPNAHIAVQDQGIGIPPGQLEQVFQPFARGSNASTRNFPGLGLGLALSKEIVEQHRGRIWVESPGPDLGSTFHIILPGAEVIY